MLRPLDDAMSESLAGSLHRAIQSRSDILLEGATEAARAILARGVHARSLHVSGRLVVSIHARRSKLPLDWRRALSGDLSELLAAEGIGLEHRPEEVGMIHLEGLTEISSREQAALAAILLERRSAPDDDRGPRIIAGVGARPAGLIGDLRKAVAEIYVPLDVAAEWKRLTIEWALEDPPSVIRTVRLERL